MYKIKNILKNIPLRISITDHCNLNCFFCSNEGMDLKLKNTAQIDFEKIIYLLKILKKNGLEQVSITGGEPMCYPELKKFLEKVNELEFRKTFFHTNGTALNKELIQGSLKEFDKVAISIHTLDFLKWQNMTKGNKSQFNEVIENLNLISKEGYGSKIEIKIVPIKNYNYSLKSIKKTLDFCSANNFKFKFLIFEPIKEDHRSLIIGIKEVASLLNDMGAIELPKEDNFRSQADYLPINRYKYESTEGVLIEIGCGKKEVCRSCSNSNEIFITPSLEIKPCHISPYTISLSESIDAKDENQILKKIIESRCFLATNPGENKICWSEDDEK